MVGKFAIFFIAIIIAPIFHNLIQISIFVVIALLFMLVNIYDETMYFLDALIITTKRVVRLDWINLIRYEESECRLDDIQDIETWENGFLARFKILDFGEFVLETSSKKSIIKFRAAPDPEGIKYFIVNVARNHSSIHNEERLDKNILNLRDKVDKSETSFRKLEKK